MSNAKKILIGSLWIAAACSVLGFVTLSREKSHRETIVPANLSANQPIVIDEKGIPLDPGELEVLFPAPEFSLQDADGGTFNSSQLKGHVYIARFFFSECSDICPMMSQRLIDLQKSVDDDRVKFVSLTVDPEKDTPAVMRAYRDKISELDKARHIFLTGSVEQMQTVVKDYRFDVKPIAEHSQQLILIDGDGQVRGLYWTTLDTDMQKLKTDVQKLLNEKP